MHAAIMHSFFSCTPVDAFVIYVVSILRTRVHAPVKAEKALDSKTHDANVVPSGVLGTSSISHLLSMHDIDAFLSYLDFLF